MSSNVVDGRSSFSEQRSRSMSGIRNFVETEVESDPRKRYVFKWLPKICHNDLVEGAWWFVWGSLTSALIALITLMDVLGVKMFNENNVTSLNAFSNASTWILLFVCAMFFTVGSFGYVRAFSTPPKPPLFKWRHFATDELFGSWMNFFALIPCIFYCVVYVVNEPSGSVNYVSPFKIEKFSFNVLYFRTDLLGWIILEFGLHSRGWFCRLYLLS